MALPGGSGWTLWASLLVVLCVRPTAGWSGWAGCFDGQDVSAKICENSPRGARVADLMVDTNMAGVHWGLTGKDADWFYLDQGTIRLNTSDDRILDRETLGPVLMAQLSCYEEDIPQSVYRMMVEIINENDNKPIFADNTARSLAISELTAVDTVAFKVQATDEDEDKILYTIDRTSPDAEHFRIDLPNSGEVILSKPLDYESKTELTVTIYASEVNTAEHFNISTNISISVLDGDDQYPQFLPCILVFQDDNKRICTNPVYAANVTEGGEDVVLHFSPAPIHAEDGDKGLNSPVKYMIISGDDDGCLAMDEDSGEVRLAQCVTDRIRPHILQLTIIAYQENDPMKYSVTTAEVRFIGMNQFHPKFDMAVYHGFVAAGNSPASLVNTYGNKALMLHVNDRDFDQGFNPMIHFGFSPSSNHTDIYIVTQDGLLIAKPYLLKPKQKHILQIMAVDKQSREEAFATVLVEVLLAGHSAPHSALTDEHLIGCTIGKALLLTTVFVSALGCVLWMVMWLKRKRKGSRDPLERGCVAQGKHPNVSLRWFQLVSHRSAMPHMDEVSLNNEEYGTYNPSFSFYTPQDAPTSTSTVPTKISFVCAETMGGSESFSDSTPNTLESLISPISQTSAVEGNPPPGAQEGAHPMENPKSPPRSVSDFTETQSNTSLRPNPHGVPVTAQIEEALTEDFADPVTSPSSQSSVSCCSSRIASAEIDKPFRAPRARTTAHSPLLSSPFRMDTVTSPLTPEPAPLKAMLVNIDTTPPDTPTTTTTTSHTETYSIEANQPCTSLDHIEETEGCDAEGELASPSQDRRLSTVSADTQDDHAGGEKVDEDGFLGDEDVNKNSGSESSLESDEEELLRVMARCDPVFITIRK